MVQCDHSRVVFYNEKSPEIRAFLSWLVETAELNPRPPVLCLEIYMFMSFY